MILEYNPANQRYIVRVPRAEAHTVRDLQDNHGLEFFRGSPSNEAILSTEEPYAAATFYQHGTPEARHELRHIQAAIEASWATESQARIPATKTLRMRKLPPDKELWPFQVADVAYALQRKHTLVGDQPGLGKTPVAVSFANEIRAKRVLVICPASIRLQWAKVIRAWSTMPFPITIHTVLHGRRGVRPDAQWTVCSYELASTPAIGAALASHRYDLLILDEAHYLKTIDARRTRAVFGGGENRSFDALALRSERILALTGTPLPNRPREAYTLARHLCFDAIDLMSQDEFSFRFNPSREITTATGKIYIDERSGRHAELQNRLRANFMVRHEKRSVMHQLKMPVFDLVYLEENGPIRAALAAERMLDIDPESKMGWGIDIMGQISAVRKQMGLAMAPRIIEYVNTIMASGEEKLVVFAWHIEVLNQLEKAFHRYGCVRVDGSTGTIKKDLHVANFINQRSIRIIIGNVLSLGTGTDGLQSVCDHCVLGEVDWTPGNNQQAVDRLDRGGQRNQVRADICVVKGSFAERIMSTALRKLTVIDQALDRKYGT